MSVESGLCLPYMGLHKAFYIVLPQSICCVTYISWGPQTFHLLLFNIDPHGASN